MVIKQTIAKYLLWALGLTLLMSIGSASRARAIIEENDGKALLIYNIAKFTVWPETAPANTSFIFALWDDPGLAKAFENIKDLKTQGRNIRIHQHQNDRVPIDCELLIIPGHKLQTFIKSKGDLDNFPILTVTTDPNVFDAGAMVMVQVIDDHLSFSVNLGAVKASGLEISGNLLRHARKVNF